MEAAQLPPDSPARLLQGLTVAQRRAVTHGLGPLLIVAGPGSGKTTTLTRRIAWLLNSGAVLPHQLVAVTFTVKAAAEMRARVAKLLGPSAVQNLQIGTFHSVCARILREHAGAFGRNEGYSVWDEPDQKAAATRALERVAGGDVHGYLREHGVVSGRDRPNVNSIVGSVRREISLARNEGLSRERYLERTDYPAAQLVANVWQAYDAELVASNAFDFDDLLACVAQLLREAELVREAYRRRFRVGLVDEVQDTNQVQIDILDALFAPAGNLTVVGDDDQAIYRFRGADPANLLTFEERFESASRVILGRNFRSRAEIVDAARRLIEHNPRRFPKELIAHRGDGGHVERREFANDEDEASWVADEIARQLEAGVEPGEIMVVYRSGYISRTLEAALLQRGIPFKLLGQLSWWQRKIVKDAVGYLNLLTNPRDVQSLRRCAGAPSRGIGAASIGLIAAHAAEHHKRDLVAALADAEAIKSLQAKAAAALLGTELMRVSADAQRRWKGGEPHVAHLVAATIGIDGGLDQHLRREIANDPTRRDLDDQLEELRGLQEAAATYELRVPHGASLLGFFDSLLAWGIEEIEEGKETRLDLMTMHAGKGLEKDVVFVIGCEEGVSPSSRALEEDRDIGPGGPAEIEERRVCYVACTRPREVLVMTHCHRRQHSQTKGPSRYLREIGLL